MSTAPPSSASGTVTFITPSGSSQSNPTSVYEPMPGNRAIVCRVHTLDSLGEGATQVVGLAYGPDQTPPGNSMGEPVVTFTRVAGSLTDWECQQVRFKPGGAQPVCAAASSYPLDKVKVWATFLGMTSQIGALQPFYGKCVAGPPPSSSATTTTSQTTSPTTSPTPTTTTSPTSTQLTK